MTNITAVGICLVQWKPKPYADKGSGIIRKLGAYLRNYRKSKFRTS